MADYLPGPVKTGSAGSLIRGSPSPALLRAFFMPIQILPTGFHLFNLQPLSPKHPFPEASRQILNQNATSEKNNHV
jgi:hypothetical protein